MRSKRSKRDTVDVVQAAVLRELLAGGSGRCRSGKATATRSFRFKALGQHADFGAVVVKDFQTVAPFGGEYEKRAVLRASCGRTRCGSYEAVEGLAHVVRFEGEVDANTGRKNVFAWCCADLFIFMFQYFHRGLEPLTSCPCRYESVATGATSPVRFSLDGCPPLCHTSNIQQK